MDVLKSLNVCELVASLFSIHYNIISDSSHSTVGYFARPSFWLRATTNSKIPPFDSLGGKRGQTDSGHKKEIFSHVRIFHFSGKRRHIRKCS